jgi:hypothetical protein
LASAGSWTEAKAIYEAEPGVRIIFESGTPTGAPVGAFEQSFTTWPVPSGTSLRLYFQTDGALQNTAPTANTGGLAFALDPNAGQRTILATGASVSALLPSYQWNAPASGAAVVMLSDPLTQDLVMLGTASADLYVRSSVADADLEVNVSEVRPDGQEMYVQTGWLRASLRALAASAAPLWPEHAYVQADDVPLTPGDWTLVRVGIPAVGHVFRAGSKIRVSVDTPGDSRALWQFALRQFSGAATYDIGASASHPSSIVFSVQPGVSVPSPLPPCPSLRGQPCRGFMVYANQQSSP